MKKYLIILFVCLIFVTKLTAQEEASVEKSIFGIQVGEMGVWVNNEIKLLNTIALRSEIGFNATNRTIVDFFIVPKHKIRIPLIVTVEPRYYFELKRRHSKGLSIANNSATFISVKINHEAGWLMLAGKQPSNIQIIPTYAVRRNIGKHFNYEVGGGVGYQYTFTSIEKENEVLAFNLVLRIGYTF